MQSKIKVLGLVHGYFTSHTVRVLEIAKALRKTGIYEIVFSGRGQFMKLVEEAGFEWIDTDILSEDSLFNEANDKGIFWYGTTEIVEQQYETERVVIEQYKPDIIIRDAFRDLAGIVAKKDNIFDVLLMQVNTSSYYYYDFSPINMFGTENKTKRMSNEEINSMVKLSKQQFYKHVYKKIKELGIPFNKDAETGVEPNLVLIPDSNVIYPTFDLSEHYKYIGPLMILNLNKPPVWKEQFIASNKKKVIFTSGSIDRFNYVELAKKFFTTEKYCIAICEDSDDIPEGWFGSKFEISSIIDYADLFITHGGLGSTYMGLKAGVPMIALYNHMEQQANAREITKLGVGAGFYAADVPMDEMINQIDYLINNPNVKKRLAKIAKTFEENHAVELSEKYISEGYRKFKGIDDVTWQKMIASVQVEDIKDKTDEEDYVIKINRLYKSYGDVVAVNGLSLSVRKGEIFGLLGPNGAGKSTTIEILTALKKQDSGEVRVLGMDVLKDALKIKERIGVQLQDVRLFAHLTIGEIIDLFRSFYNKPTSVDEVLRKVGLEEKKDFKVNELSGGQLHRVGVAISLVGNGDIIFLDEPTAGLDPQSRRKLWDVITQLKEEKRTVFITTHFMDEAEKLCDRIAIVDKGKIIALDTPQRLIEKYCNETAVEISIYEMTNQEIFNNVKGVSRIQHGEEYITLYTTDSIIVVSQIIQLKKEKKYHFGDFRIRQSTLEDVFLKLTGGRLDNGSF